jgi:hypothetical protein
VQFSSRASQGGLTVAGARKMEAKPPLWLRLEKLELGAQDQFTGWYSLDGSSWTMLDSVSFSAAQPLLMGIVTGAGNNRAGNVARVDGIAATPLQADRGARPRRLGGRPRHRRERGPGVPCAARRVSNRRDVW